MPDILIGPFQTGIQRDREPYLLPQEAFVDLEDAYVWRGRVKKKNGYTFLGRLHRTPSPLPEVLPNINTGAVTYTTTLANSPVSPGTIIITINTIPAMTFTDNANGTLTSTTPTANFGIIDYESGTFTLTFNPPLPGGGPFAVNAIDYRTLPRQPVMGLATYDTININREDLVAFDQTRSYFFNTTTNQFDEIATGNWNSSDSDFFWWYNYFVDGSNNKLLWTTNNIAYNVALQDGIQYFNGTTWTLLQAQIDSAAPNPNFLRGSLMVIPYRDRLVALNTLEGPAPTIAGAIRYPQRIRWSQNGTPVIAVDVNAWRQDIIGRGGFLDAPTSEAIVSARFYKDTLIVFFERSTWRLRYTGNEILPFVFEQINAELGAESTFSSIQFDDGVLAVGDKRIISANSLGVTPIDQKIPDEVYKFHNDAEGPKRVHGIRDFFNQLVYWTFPNDVPNKTYPNKLLVLNYIEGSYAFFNDSFTTFGRWQRSIDYTWRTLPYESWIDWVLPWGNPKGQSWHPSIIAGNQKGFVVLLDQVAVNEESLDLINTLPVPSISNTAPAVFDLPNHNLEINDFVKPFYTRAFGINIVAESLGSAPAGSTQFIGTIANLGIFTGTVVVTIGANTFIDLGNRTLAGGTGGSTINYETGEVILNFAALGVATPVTVNYTYNIINFRVLKVTSTTVNTFTLASINPDGTLAPINFDTFGAPYTGTGQFARINNFLTKSKRFNPLLEIEESFRIQYLDLLLKNAEGSFTSDTLAGQDNSNPVDIQTVSSQQEAPAITLDPQKIWKRVFINTASNFIQLQFTMSDYQMTQFENYSSAWELHSILINIIGAGRLR